MSFMQMMNTQMQQFMQNMQHQMQHQMPVHPASSGGSLQNRLDERCFRRLDRFSNKNDDWKGWRLHFLRVIGECNSDFLKENGRKEDSTTDRDLPPELMEMSAQLQSRLINLTTKSALGVV